jgi:membrane protein implicated in regulation of membrane protease activity
VTSVTKTPERAGLPAAIDGPGALFVWPQTALGPLWASFAGFCAWWWPGVLVMVATSDLVVTIWQFIKPSQLSNSWQEGIVTRRALALGDAPAGDRAVLSRGYRGFTGVRPRALVALES